MCALYGIFVIEHTHTQTHTHTQRNILNAPNKDGLVKYIWVCPNNGTVFKIFIQINIDG